MTNFHSFYQGIWNYFFHNTYTIKRMVWQHLVIPWVLIDFIVFAWFMLGLHANSAGAFKVLIYIFIPLIFFYLLLVNVGLCIKSLLIKTRFKKIMALAIFGIFSILSALGLILFIGVAFLRQ